MHRVVLVDHQVIGALPALVQVGLGEAVTVNRQRRRIEPDLHQVLLVRCPEPVRALCGRLPGRVGYLDLEHPSVASAEPLAEPDLRDDDADGPNNLTEPAVEQWPYVDHVGVAPGVAEVAQHVPVDAVATGPDHLPAPEAGEAAVRSDGVRLMVTDHVGQGGGAGTGDPVEQAGQIAGPVVQAATPAGLLCRIVGRRIDQQTDQRSGPQAEDVFERLHSST